MRGDAVLVSRGAYVMLAIDRFVPPATVGDGMADTVFMFASDGSDASLSLLLRDAHVEFAAGRVMVSSASERKAFIFTVSDFVGPEIVLPRMFTTRRYTGFQLSHRIVEPDRTVPLLGLLGPNTPATTTGRMRTNTYEPDYDGFWEASGGSNNGGTTSCANGGTGSTQCSIDITVAGTGGGCSVTCGPGYYACCNAGTSGCKCIKY